MPHNAPHASRRPFHRAFQWLLLTTVFWSFTALASTGELPALVALGGYPMILAAWLGEKRYPLSRWTWGFLIAGALCFLGWYFEARGRTDAIIYLLLFLLINKLWTPKKPRDLLQIYVITFFFMLAAAILTMSMAFMLFFVGYVFLLVVGLAFLTVRREHVILASLGGDRRAGVNPDEDVPTEFYLRAGGGVLVIFFITFWVFALFPRFSEQQLLPGFGSMQGTGQSGFTDDIQLGDLSDIELDPTMAMRVFLSTADGNPRPLDHLYLRGAVLEHYEDGRWSQNPDVHAPSREVRLAGSFIPLDVEVPLGEKTEIRQAIYLAPTAAGNLFMLDNATSLRVEAGRDGVVITAYDDRANTVRLLSRQPKEVSYAVISQIDEDRILEEDALPEGDNPAPSRGYLRRAGFLRGYTQALSRTRIAASDPAYLQLPPGISQDRIRTLAESIILSSGAQSALESARAIERHLQTNYQYTLNNLNFGDREPVEAFLFEERRGHCEYFASAMALLLRQAGIPSRIVNGYYTDRWNDIGEFYEVQKADAHAWVEAFIDPLGWVRFDASPPAGIVREPAEKGLWYKLRLWSNAIAMKWRLHVIDYDLEDQVEFVRSLDRNTPELGFVGQWLSRGSQIIRGDGEGREAAGRMALFVGFAIAAAIAAGMGLLAFRRLRFRRGHAKRRFQSIIQHRRVVQYEKIMKALARKGLHRAPGVTPLEFARKIEKSNPQFQGFAQLTRQYYEIRFAERPMRPTDAHGFTTYLRKARTLAVRRHPAHPMHAEA